SATSAAAVNSAGAPPRPRAPSLRTVARRDRDVEDALPDIGLLPSAIDDSVVRLGGGLSPWSYSRPRLFTRTNALHSGSMVGDRQRRGAPLAGRYRLERFIAQGGMGKVYEAVDLELDERVALKTLRADLANDPRGLARFKREITLARRVTHPNVCRLYDFG